MSEELKKSFGRFLKKMRHKYKYSPNQYFSLKEELRKEFGKELINDERKESS